MIRKPALLKRPHNILLLSLAIMDLLTGVLLLLTPGYVISFSSFPFPSGLVGEICCLVFGSGYFLCIMGKVSIFKVSPLSRH